MNNPGESIDLPPLESGHMLSRGVNGYVIPHRLEAYATSFWRAPVTVHGSGSGPFFGRQTRPRRYTLAENMDLTPWNQAKSSTGP